MQVLRNTLLVGTALMLQACATGTVKHLYTPMERSQEANTRYSAPLGAAVFEEKQAIVANGAVLEEAVVSDRYGIAAGAVLFERSLRESPEKIFCSRYGTVTDRLGNIVGSTCFRDTDLDGRFDVAEFLGQQGFKLVTLSPEQIQPVAYRKEEVRLREMDFEYVAILESASETEVSLSLMVQEQITGCVHRRGTKRIDLTLGMPARAYLTPAMFLPHVADMEPRTSESPPLSMDDFQRRTQEQMAHKIVILGWNNGTLDYQLDLKNIVWTQDMREGFSGCDVSSTAEVDNNG
jgi:hypothetical protein